MLLHRRFIIDRRSGIIIYLAGATTAALKEEDLMTDLEHNGIAGIQELNFDEVEQVSGGWLAVARTIWKVGSLILGAGLTSDSKTQ